jgi:hypothetical protein
MIVFDLKCGDGHVFEAWFGSSEDYEDQRGRGLVQCPLCGSGEVGKAVMAPSVGRKGNSGAAEAGMVTSDPQAVKAMLTALAEAQKRVLANSDFVGDRFAEEARAIHVGESANRAIHGRATPAQTQSLIEDGISVSPLPFPVIEPGQEN